MLFPPLRGNPLPDAPDAGADGRPAHAARPMKPEIGFSDPHPSPPFHLHSQNLLLNYLNAQNLDEMNHKIFFPA
jgi:hypothetical protein